MIDWIIKYLNSITKFDISNVKISLTFITSSLTKSIKSSFNIEIIKIYCDINKNNFATHIKKEKEVILTKKSCFLRLNDRTFVKKKHLYIFMSVYEILIKEEFIWFISFMFTFHDKQVTVLNIMTKHTTWKIEVYNRYVTKFKKYFHAWTFWKYSLFEHIITHHYDNVFWFTNMLIFDMLFIVMSYFLNFDDYTILIKIEHEHAEFFLKFMINLFVAHHLNQTSTTKIKTSKIKNESSKKLIKLVNISNTKNISQKFICIINVFDLSMNLNNDFITFEKSQNTIFQNDTHYEWSSFINFISIKSRFEHFKRFIL